MSEQRERFEEWAKEYGLDITRYPGDSDYYEEPDASSAWDAWQAACPEGWQAVPKEPTEDMTDAAVMALDGLVSARECGKAHKAQLSAAPKPEDV